MSDLEDIIKERIHKEGRITFADFMAMALYYHPAHRQFIEFIEFVEFRWRGIDSTTQQTL